MPFCGATDTLYHDAAHSMRPGRQTLYRLSYGGSAYFMSFILFRCCLLANRDVFTDSQRKVMFSETFVCPQHPFICRADPPPPGGRPPWYWHLVATTVGTHPTGMHSCWKIYSVWCRYVAQWQVSLYVNILIPHWITMEKWDPCSWSWS